MCIPCVCRWRNCQSHTYCSNMTEFTPAETYKIHNYHKMAAMPIKNPVNAGTPGQRLWPGMLLFLALCCHIKWENIPECFVFCWRLKSCHTVMWLVDQTARSVDWAAGPEGFGTWCSSWHQVVTVHTKMLLIITHVLINESKTNAEIKYIIASWLPINVRDTLRTNDNDNSCSVQLKQKNTSYYLHARIFNRSNTGCMA